MTILAAAGVAILVLLAGNILWAGFGPVPGLAHLNRGQMFPWAVLPMALYLLAYWWFLDGRLGDPESAPRRRANLRARPLALRMWAASLGVGLVGFGALIAALVAVARVVELPAGPPIDGAGMPAATVVALLVMQSLVAGVSEEAAFRGYLQSMIEREHGLVVAILVGGTLFGLLHFGNHPGDVLRMLPYYLAVSAVYGGITWAADSVLPAVVLHSAGDVVMLTRWWWTGRPEWQLGPAAAVPAAGRGLDAPFLTAVLLAAVLGVATALGCRAVRRLRDAELPPFIPVPGPPRPNAGVQS